LRSSSHRVRASKHTSVSTTGIRPILPPLLTHLRSELIIPFNHHPLLNAVIQLLQSADSERIGGWNETQEMIRLENFCVPTTTLTRRCYGGKCEKVQKYWSNYVASNVPFLKIFDDLVVHKILPLLKARVQAANSPLSEEGTCNQKLDFYYQRPPTIRIQPGPAWSIVKHHRDSEYGHQDGEINYWIPLTSPELTNVDLFVESHPDAEDYHPMNVQLGEMGVFHGSSCRHYIPANGSDCTRISLDFRVGIGGYYDTEYLMVGSKDDHCRRTVRL